MQSAGVFFLAKILKKSVGSLPVLETRAGDFEGRALWGGRGSENMAESGRRQTTRKSASEAGIWSGICCI